LKFRRNRLETIVAFLMATLLIHLNAPIVEAEEEQTFTLNVYQGPYNAGELRAVIKLGDIIDNMWSIGVGWVKPEFLAAASGEEIPGGDIYVYVHENTHTVNIWMDQPQGKLYLELVGQSGTGGHIVLYLSKRTIPSRDDFKIYLDNQQIEFTMWENELDPIRHYMIEINYTHSTRVLMLEGLKVIFPVWYTQPLNLVFIALAIVAALGALYWFRFRR
jgi:hypothetical protein